MEDLPSSSDRDARWLSARVLEPIRGWASRRNDVRAVLLVGSYARGAARPDSDVDLVILVDRPDEYLVDRSCAELLGPVTRVEVERWGAITSVRAWYEDGLEVELGFGMPSWITSVPLDPGTASVLRDGAVVVVDRIGGLDRTVREVV